MQKSENRGRFSATLQPRRNLDAEGCRTAALERFLIQETGLPRKHVITLYNAGHPWPLWTAHDIRRAGTLAQAKGLLFPDALAEAEAGAERATRFVDIGSDDRRRAHASLTEQLHDLLSLQWFRAMHDHVEQVAARTAFTSRTVFLFPKAIQHFATQHPGFELVGAFPQKRHFLC